jgi:hypothetical protein
VWAATTSPHSQFRPCARAPAGHPQVLGRRVRP